MQRPCGSRITGSPRARRRGCGEEERLADPRSRRTLRPWSGIALCLRKNGKHRKASSLMTHGFGFDKIPPVGKGNGKERERGHSVWRWWLSRVAWMGSWGQEGQRAVGRDWQKRRGEEVFPAGSSPSHEAKGSCLRLESPFARPVLQLSKKYYWLLEMARGGCFNT